MKKGTINDTLKTYLEQFDEFEADDVKKLIKKFHAEVKDKKKEADEDEDEKPEIRHGTTCFGVINRKHKKVAFEG